jgi:hypothetical protein
MTVSELRRFLAAFGPDQEVVISGAELGTGTDFLIEQVHQYDDANYVRLCPGDRFEDD